MSYGGTSYLKCCEYDTFAKSPLQSEQNKIQLLLNYNYLLLLLQPKMIILWNVNLILTDLSILFHQMLPVQRGLYYNIWALSYTVKGAALQSHTMSSSDAIAAIPHVLPAYFYIISNMWCLLLLFSNSALWSRLHFLETMFEKFWLK